MPLAARFFSFLICALSIFTLSANAQKKDSVVVTSGFSGLMGVTTNGISIIPTFSLNAPAVNFLLSVKKNRFSFDPDIRATFDGKKGSLVFWFRYQAIKGKRFNLQTGAHPAYNLALREIISSNTSSGFSTITQARRFVATEIFPSYRVSNKVSLGIYYLRGFGLQKDGPINSNFLTFNTNISGIRLFKDHYFQYTPQFYYLKLDQNDGFYYTHTIGISSTKHPFLLQSTINKEIKTNIPGSQNFAWNLTLFYAFNKKYGRMEGQDILKIADQITDF